MSTRKGGLWKVRGRKRMGGENRGGIRGGWRGREVAEIIRRVQSGRREWESGRMGGREEEGKRKSEGGRGERKRVREREGESAERGEKIE